MGAFGELLIQTWGGDLDKYLGNIPTNRDLGGKQESIKDETTEEDKERFRYEYKLSTARHRLDILTTNLMYEPKSIENYTEESIKNGFKQLGFDSNIQNIMWCEYCSFLDKYINKD